MQIFKDLSIIEVASALAGPQAGTFFKELGADILKVEPPQGDISRRWRSGTEDLSADCSIYYSSVNGDKKSVRLDLQLTADRDQLGRWLADCDVLITNFSDRQAQRFGLDYGRLGTQYPKLILANLTGFGRQSDRRAFDVLMQAETGYLSMTGEPNRPPSKIPIPFIDIIAGHQLKEAILVALYRRTITNKGGEIQLSLFDSAISALANQASNYLMGGTIPGPMGTQHPSIAPYGDLYRTRDDQWLVLAIGSDQHFKTLCQGMGLTDLPRDIRFSTNANRVTHRTLLNGVLQERFAQDTLEQWLDKFETNDILGGPVRDLAQVFALPQSHHLIAEEELPDRTLSRRVKTAVFQWSE